MRQVPELRLGTPATSILDDIARTGFDGCQLGLGFPEGDELRRAWLHEVAATTGIASFETGAVGFAAQREAQIDALADAVEEHLDLDRVLDLVTSGAPALPVVRGGLA